MDQIRQGDVLLIPSTQVPSSWKVQNDTLTEANSRTLKGRGKVILEGEITNHIHLLPEYDDSVFYENESGDLIIKANSDTEIRHDCPGQEKPDHDTLPVSKGEYLFVPQCEWISEDIRSVWD